MLFFFPLQLWETKVLQSKATEDFFRNSVQAPLFTLQLPHGLPPALQSTGWRELVKDYAFRTNSFGTLFFSQDN